MKVCLITATKDRHRQLERLVRFSLNQTSPNFVHLIFNNSLSSLRLNSHLPEDKYLLINSPASLKTHKPYKTLGEIYMDAIRFIPLDCDAVNFMDDDDIFLPNHVEEGIKGLELSGKKAYKPQKSWYRTKDDMLLVQNVMEPSIFVKTDHIKQYGFGDETSAQHLKWVNPLLIEKEMFADPNGEPTYVCDWSQEISTFKTSGNPNNPNNFHNYTKWSTDKGDGIITPCSQSWAEHYYQYVK